MEYFLSHYSDHISLSQQCIYYGQWKAVSHYYIFKTRAYVEKENWFGERRTMRWDEFPVITHNAEINKPVQESYSKIQSGGVRDTMHS